MPDRKARLHDEFEKLKQRRDELRVQLDLGNKEARAAWEEAEGKWAQLEGRLKVLARESKDAAGDVAEKTAEKAEVLLKEVKDGFARLRNHV